MTNPAGGLAPGAKMVAGQGAVDVDAPLPFSLKMGFGVGTVGVSVLLQTVTIYLPVFMATVLGLSPAIAGYLLTGSKIFDIFVDMWIGAKSDRTKHKWGRRRPFLLVGALVSFVSFLLLFNPFFGGGTTTIICIGLVLMVYSVGYSLFSVPYMAMPAEMTDGYHQRTSLMSYRTLFIAVGQTISVSGAAWIIGKLGGDKAAFSTMAVLLGVVMLGAMLATFFATAKARIVERVETIQKVDFRKHARLLFENKPFVLLISAKLCLLLGLASVSTTQLLFFLNVAKIGYDGLIWMGLASNIVLALSMPFWLYMGRRFGKRNVYIASILIYAVSVASWLLVQDPEPMVWVALRGVLKGFSSGGILLLGTSMLPDTMDYDRSRTGLRREGIFSGTYAIIEKFAYALGPAMVGLYLSMMGYIPTKGGQLVEQPASAVNAMFFGVAVLPTVLALIGVVILLFYRLDRKRLDEAREAGVVG